MLVYMFDNIIIFIKVVETNSLGKAAQLLNKQVSTISKHLADLEYELKKQLFIRDTRNIRITEYGQFLYDRFKHLPSYLSDTLNTNHLNNNVNTNDGELNISLGSAISYELISPYLDRFTELNPRIKLNISHIANISQWPDLKTDIVLASQYLEGINLDNRFLRSEYVKLYCRSEYAMKYGLPLEPIDLPNHRFLGGLDIKGKPLDYLILKNIKNNEEFILDASISQIRLNNQLHLKKIGANSDFIFGSFDSLCVKEVQSGAFIQVLPEWVIFKLDFYLVTKKNIGQNEQLFIDFIYHCMSTSYNKIVSRLYSEN